jgi:DNA-binding transcriptional MocR family regulator
MKLYQQLADDLTLLIRQGALKPGERVPSVRETSRERGMSPATVEDLSAGSAELRRQISRRYLRSGAAISPDEIIVTAGALEALNLSLQTLTRPGDLVAIESPAFYGCLQAVESLGLKAIEIPTHPTHGVDLGYLARILEKHPVRACWFMTTFQNPLGALVPDDARKELVELLESHDVPLIEDDVYSELYFGSRRPKSTKAFDRKGLVLNCGSFSKSLAPGYRIGWVAAGRVRSTPRHIATDVRRAPEIGAAGLTQPFAAGLHGDTAEGRIFSVAGVSRPCRRH